MRKFSALAIAAFAAAVVTGQVDRSEQIGSIVPPEGVIEVVKEVVGDVPAGTAPWSFTITSENCGDAIFDNDAGLVDELNIVIAAAGGSVAVNALILDPLGAAIGVPTDLLCEYTVVETPVAGWTTEPGSYSDVTLTAGVPTVLTFVNTPPPPTTTTTTTTTTTVPETTTTVPEATTTVPEATTTVPETTTTVSETTLPAPTTAVPAPTTTVPDDDIVTVVLPETGSDSTGTIALMALIALAGGVAATLLSRRNPGTS